MSRGLGVEPVGLPDALPGHWESIEGMKIAEEYASRARCDLMMGHLSDYVLANAQFMASRNSLDLTAYQTAAKERIRWLSVRLALAEARPGAGKTELPPEDAPESRDRIEKAKNMDDPGRELTERERKIAIALGEVWNQFLQLPTEHGDDVSEFRQLIHAAQEKVLSRVGRRQINCGDDATQDGWLMKFGGSFVAGRAGHVDDVELVVARLTKDERERITGWHGPSGAAYNAVSEDLQEAGLLTPSWTLTPLGIQVRLRLEAENSEPSL